MSKFKSLLVGILFLSLGFLTTLSNATSLNNEAIQFAKEIAIKHDHDENLVAAIIMVESKAGQHAGYEIVRNGRSTYYGMAQLTIGAAKDVLKTWPNLLEKYDVAKNDKAIKHALAYDYKFNIEVASKYLLMIRNQFGFTDHKLINSYNLGPGSKQIANKDFYYSRKVRKFMGIL